MTGERGTAGVSGQGREGSKRMRKRVAEAGAGGEVSVCSSNVSRPHGIEPGAFLGA